MTLEEIQAAMNENPELAAQVAEVAVQTDKGKEILSNHAKNYFDEKIGEHMSNHYNKLDEEIHKLTGKMKPKNVKSYEHVYSVIEELKNAQGSGDSEKVKELEDKLKEAKEKLKSGGDGEGFYKKELETLRTQTEQEKSELQKKIENLNGQIISTKVESDIRKGLSGITFNKSIPTESRERLIDIEVEKLIKTAKVEEDGTIVYTDENGNMIKNNDHSRANGAQAIKGRLASLKLLDVKAPGGTDGAGGGNKGGSGDNGIEIGDLSSFKTQAEIDDTLNKALLKKGVAIGSEEYNKTIDDFYKENPAASELPKF